MNSTDGMYNICVSNCGKLSAQPITVQFNGKSVTGYFCQRCSAPTALENGVCVTTCASHYVEYDYDVEMYRCVNTCPDTKCLKDISDLIPDTMQCIQNKDGTYFKIRDTGECTEACDAVNVTSEWRWCEEAGELPYCPTLVQKLSSEVDVITDKNYVMVCSTSQSCPNSYITHPSDST